MLYVLGVIKKNPLFAYLHEIEWKNNGFFFTTPNIIRYARICALAHFEHKEQK